MNITYKIKRSRKRRKTISLQINDKSESVVIAAPYLTPIDEINHFVQEKQNWINKTIQRHKEEAIKNKAPEYKTSEKFYYLGQSYPLEVFFEPFDTAGVFFWNNCFYLNAQEDRNLRKHYFVSWYKKKAREYICQRVYFFSRKLKLHYRNITITSAGKRWGSCSTDNDLSFSFRLMMAPPDIIDYVIVHELMHIIEKNHSPKFWQRVDSIMPEHKAQKRWLKDNHHKFIL
ncbi:MAG: M48 family peptidase [Deltaproteobacteria bacterium HGW-Deltaproteobacteria-2]|jgi:hypothetical protein|nr:MAG: M48 family peptidase [Deltaproteobacteria bacterium HGW-Deltaproteobacteria-2]